MPGGITLKESAPVDIPTPDTGKATIFIDSTAVPTPIPSYKDDGGSVFPLGTTGSTGAPGPAGPVILHEDGVDGVDGFPGIPGPPGPAGAGQVLAGFVKGRLTLETGVPISISDQTAKSTLFFTPYLGNVVALYTGSAWEYLTFVETSFALSGLTSGKNYDVFGFDSSGTLTLVLSAAWSSDTARTDALALQDGVPVLSSDHTRLHLGTIRTTGTTTTEDSNGGTTTQVGGKRFVWNRYNQVPRPLNVRDTTDSWVYKTATWRQANAATGNKVEFVVGDKVGIIDALVIQTIGLQLNTGTAAAGPAVGFDSITSPSGIHCNGFQAANTFEIAPSSATYKAPVDLGYHFISWMEIGIPGTECRFYGDNAGVDIQSGLSALLSC